MLHKFQLAFEWKDIAHTPRWPNGPLAPQTQENVWSGSILCALFVWSYHNWKSATLPENNNIDTQYLNSAIWQLAKSNCYDSW